MERVAAERRRREAAAQAELEAIHGCVPRSRVVDYNVPELRSGGGRQGRPVARGHRAEAGGAAAAASGGDADDGGDAVEMECGSTDGDPVTLAEVVSVTQSEPVTVAEVGSVVQRQVQRRGGALVGLARSAAWRRRHRQTAAAQVRRIGSSGRSSVGGVSVSRWLADYVRATVAAMERARRWTWGIVLAGWGALQGERRVRPRTGGVERVHGRPPEGTEGP